ncbi:hypothetical protein JET18_06705 [Chryseobacterium sp. L7]|uniref:CHRD domain-containing protein n=1 Tax=Chryseobacterium endalhagicum TaxID=2797638 RepID=A0ABS1QD28_9FLAO|nr:hypothetical protein [Chryseobacterium endalhagicum]MBL1220521.1 hypothetical protein [Chryseobacterium endalhagicum]
MKILTYILILLSFGSSCSAQRYTLIEAVHTTDLGGVRGSRTENFSITLKKNSKIEPSYLLAGTVKIPLKKESKNSLLYLQGTYQPESPDHITVNEDGNAENSELNQIFDLNMAYLVSENLKNKKQVKQKINFMTKNNDKK